MSGSQVQEVIRTLLVEDSAGDARLIQLMLDEVDAPRFELVREDRLAAALPRLTADVFDVVLLDLSLPDAHGLETVRRTLEAAPRSAIVVLTGLDDQTVALRAVQAGAQDYLVKGQFEAAVLTRSIRYAMERKRLDRERQRLLEVAQEARSEAEGAVRARDEVLRIVSHDLGNSLSAVGIHATLLERSRATEAEEDEVRRRAVAIRQLVKQMHELRQDLLDAASIEAGRLSMNPYPQDFPALFAEISDLVNQLTAEKELGFRIEFAPELPAVVADRQRLHQVMMNLLGNAVKFTPSGGEITIRAGVRGTDLHVEVADTGPGIPPDKLEHIFDRFWKGGRDDRQGAGLGLAIAQGIVHAHGGTIWVESEQGVGSRFHFTVPLHRPVPRPHAEPRAEA